MQSPIWQSERRHSVENGPQRANVNERPFTDTDSQDTIRTLTRPTIASAEELVGRKDAATTSSAVANGRSNVRITWGQNHVGETDTEESAPESSGFFDASETMHDGPLHRSSYSRRNTTPRTSTTAPVPSRPRQFYDASETRPTRSLSQSGNSPHRVSTPYSSRETPTSGQSRQSSTSGSPAATPTTARSRRNTAFEMIRSVLPSVLGGQRSSLAVGSEDSPDELGSSETPLIMVPDGPVCFKYSSL